MDSVLLSKVPLATVSVNNGQSTLDHFYSDRHSHQATKRSILCEKDVCNLKTWWCNASFVLYMQYVKRNCVSQTAVNKKAGDTQGILLFFLLVTKSTQMGQLVKACHVWFTKASFTQFLSIQLFSTVNSKEFGATKLRWFLVQRCHATIARSLSFGVILFSFKNTTAEVVLSDLI